MWSRCAGVRWATVSSVNGEAFGSQGVECVGEVDGWSTARRRWRPAEAQRLVDLIVEVLASDVTLVGKEQAAAQEACRPDHKNNQIRSIADTTLVVWIEAVEGLISVRVAPRRFAYASVAVDSRTVG